MLTFIAVIHVVICLLLIGLVLLQDPKSSGGGGVFGGGGGSNSLLGATGAVTFLTRLTRYSAIVFGITCLILTLLSRPNVSSVLDTAAPVAPTAPAPTTEAPQSTLPATLPAAPPASEQTTEPPAAQ